MTTLTTHC